MRPKAIVWARGRRGAARPGRLRSPGSLSTRMWCGWVGAVRCRCEQAQVVSWVGDEAVQRSSRRSAADLRVQHGQLPH
eukprot:167962-Prorocentrum_minimum.AAC.1